MKKNRIFALLAVLLLAVASNARARAAEPVIFALFARGWEPYEMLVDGQPRGVALDILAAVLPSDVSMQVEPLPDPRRLLLSSDKVYARLEAREWLPPEVDLPMSDPVVSLSDVLLSPADSPVEFNGAKSLAGLTIGCIKGYAYPALDELFGKELATRYDVNSVPVLLRMVKEGRVDAAVVDRLNSRWKIRAEDDLSFNDFHVAPRPVESVDLVFVFSRVPGWENNVERINKGIDRCRRSGALKTILSRYE